MTEPEVNPYQTHNLGAAVAVQAGGAIAEDGLFVVRRRGTLLPPFCVKCGMAAQGDPMKLTARRAIRPRWLQVVITILLGPSAIIFLNMALERATVRAHLCHAHRRRELQLRWLVFAMIAGSVAAFLICMALAAIYGEIWWFAIAFLAFAIGMVGIMFAELRSKPLVARKLTKRDVWLDGVHPALYLVTAQGPTSAQAQHDND